MSTDLLSCAGALIVDDRVRIFVPRRSPHRRRFPGAWDIVGGPVGADDGCEDALRREVTRQTGWTVSAVLATVGQYPYLSDDGSERLQTSFLVRVDGDLDKPRLVEREHVGYRWVAQADLGLLDGDREVDGGLVRRVVADGFAILQSIGAL